MTAKMKRREFITLLGGGAAAWPLAARAQQAKMPRIGIIDNAAIWDHFRQGLRDLGYIEGRNIAIEYRSAEGRPERLAAVASELARLPVDVIVTFIDLVAYVSFEPGQTKAFDNILPLPLARE